MIDVRCPICDLRMQGASPREWPEFPFCSRRCKVIDLGRWLGEAYSVHQEARARKVHNSSVADCRRSQGRRATLTHLGRGESGVTACVRQ